MSKPSKPSGLALSSNIKLNKATMVVLALALAVAGYLIYRVSFAALYAYKENATELTLSGAYASIKTVGKDKVVFLTDNASYSSARITSETKIEKIINSYQGKGVRTCTEYQIPNGSATLIFGNLFSAGDSKKSVSGKGTFCTPITPILTKPQSTFPWVHSEVGQAYIKSISIQVLELPKSNNTTLKISDDGCTVTAMSSTEATLTISAGKEGMGGSYDVSLTPGTKVTKSTGGQPGYNASATISSGGSTLASTSRSVTASCPPPSV